MKRIVCFLLALIMVMGLIPNAMVTANAYSTQNTSSKAIDILRGSVTFFEKETSGKVGYGTPSDYSGAKKYLNAITKEDAIDLMRDYIEEVIDEKINDFTKDYNVDLKQNEHDALAVHIYRTGDLTNANGLYEVIRTVKTVNSAADRAAIVQAFVDAHQHSITYKEDLLPTLNVSLSEAAMYLYGTYGYNGDSRLGHVRLSTDGNNVSDVLLGYVKNDGLELYDPQDYDSTGLDDSEFLGWFVYSSEDKGPSGAPLTKVTKSHDGKILIAKKSDGDKEAAKYNLNTKKLTDLNVYDKNQKKTGYILEKDTTFQVTYEYLDSNGVKWVYGKGTSTKDKTVKGWIKVGKLEAADPKADKPIASATITSNTLAVYPGATADGAAAIHTLNKNDVVSVYETKVEKTETGNKRWGKIIFEMVDTSTGNTNTYIGWINLANADVNETQGESGAAEGQTGKIANYDWVNIRSGAGTANTKLTSLEKGTKVTVLETTMVGDAQWAKIKWSTPSNGYTQGWVYMYYVQLDSAPVVNNGSSSSATPKYTGVVTSNINLNVRRKPDIYSTKVDSLPTGTKVNVYETTTNKNMKWGRIGTDKWVCLTYLALTEVEQPKDNTTTTTTTTQGTVNVATLNVLKNYNSNAEKVGTLEKGDVVTILEKNTETTDTGTRIWGRISKDGVKGWINLAYVDLKTVTSVSGGTSSGSSSSGTNYNGASGVISNCISVNIREGAGVSNKQITKLNNGTAVKVYKQVTKDNAPWAKITWNNGANEGWVCMNYVTVNAAGVEGTTEGGLVNGTNSNTISATGTVNSNIDLNVRAGAGLGYNKVGSLKKGTKVTIFEQVSADGMIWGRMNYANGTGWVCMSYINVEAATSTGKGVMGTVARCFKAVNVRSAPGTGNALVATINVGSRVEVFETREYANQMWGRVAQGWVCMDYVLLDSELPPGTILDATEPTTEATNSNDSDEETINRDGEIAFTVEATILQDLNVRNDADADSDRVGTVKSGLKVDIRALKNNGPELWGRIDQYATAGWINMDAAYVTYEFKDLYVAVDEQPVYTDADMNSTVKGNLNVNTMLDITKVTTDGTNVYGWVEAGIFGWVPMSKLVSEPVEVIKTFKNGDSVGDNNNAMITGKTYASMEAYDSIGGSKVLYKLATGVNVNIELVKFENGKVWGCVAAFDQFAAAWIDMGKVNYALGSIVNTEMNIRSTMDASTDADDENNNIIKTIPANEQIQICQLAFDGYGNLWGRITGNADATLNGAFIMVMSSDRTVYVPTVINDVLIP